MINSELGRDFWCFRLGEVVSELGLWSANLALAWWVLEVTGSASAMASIMVPYMLVTLICKPLLAPLGDRYSRKHLMLLGHLCHLLSLVAMGFLLLSAQLSLAGAIVGMMVFGLANSIFGSGSNAVLAQLVRRDQLVAANAQIQSLNAITTLAGGMVGAGLLAWLGTGGTFLVAAAGYGVAFLGVALIRQSTQPQSAVRPAYTGRQWFDDLREGFRVTWQLNVIFTLVLVFSIINLLLAPLQLLLPFLVQQQGLSSWHLGVLQSCIGVGIIVGVLVLPALGGRLAADRIVLLAVAGFSLALLFAGLARHYWVLAGMIVLVMMCINWINVLVNSQIMLALPDHYRARLGSVLELTATAGIPLSLATSGVLLDWLGPWWLLCSMGGLCLLMVPVLTGMKDLKTYLSASADEVPHWLQQRYPGVLQPRAD